MFTIPNEGKKVNIFPLPVDSAQENYGLLNRQDILYKKDNLYDEEQNLSLALPGLPSGMPNCLKKRQLLNEKLLSPALCRDYGLKFLDLGWREDALEFFKKGEVTEELEKLKAISLETGDAFLLARIGNQEPAVWRLLAERALALGKLYFARRAFEIAGDADKTAMVAGLIAGQASPPDEAADN
jgi:hypothetical protein